jgi:hypothetical protein
MASDPDISGVIPECGAYTESDTQDASQSGSGIWLHARPQTPSRPIRCEKKRKIWYCEPCWSRKRRDTHYKLYAGTNSVFQHLRSHGIYLRCTNSKRTDSMQKKLTDQESWATISTNKPRKPQDHFLDFRPSDIDAVTLRGLYTNLVIQKNLSLALCEAPEFRAFLHYANPYTNKLLPTTRPTIRADIMREYADKQVLVRQALHQSNSKIHFSVDAWTTPNQKGILGIVVHFVINKLGLQHLLLALQEVEGSHTGEAYEMETIALYEFYGILDRMGYMQADNAKNNDTMGSWLSQELEDRGISWDNAKYRVRCIGHIINLSVQAFLRGLSKDFDFKSSEDGILDKDFNNSPEVKRWRKLGPLGKLRNLVVYILASPKRRQIWKEYAPKLLKKHNATRWNSVYTMIGRAIELRSALDKYMIDYKDDLPDTLTLSDWTFLENVHEFLERFYEATKATESDDETLAGVLFTMDFLIRHYRANISDYPKTSPMEKCLDAGYKKLDDYYSLTDHSPAYAAAIVLDPTWKWGHFEDAWIDKPLWIQKAKNKVQQLWINDYKNTITTTSSASTTTAMEPPPKRLKSSFNDYRNRPRPQPVQTYTIEDEYDRYLGQNLVIPTQRFNPLEWWLDPHREVEFPSLRRMAIDILSIPSMAASNERIFSHCKDTMSYKRCSMDPYLLEAIECLRSWNNSGLLGTVSIIPIAVICIILTIYRKLHIPRSTRMRRSISLQPKMRLSGTIWKIRGLYKRLRSKGDKA